MKDTRTKCLSRGDLATLLEIANGCLDCIDLDRLTYLLTKLKRIANFDSALCTCAEPSRLPASLNRAMRPINFHCPHHVTDMWQSDRCYQINLPLPVILPCLYLPAGSGTVFRPRDNRLNVVMPAMPDDHLHHGWIYGSHERGCNRLVLLVFAYHAPLDDAGARMAIELVAPHLLHAFRNLKYLCCSHPFHLTKREHEVLRWLQVGHTSRKISEILDISERCVVFHIENLKKKLSALNRTQAVAIAVANRLIKP